MASFDHSVIHTSVKRSEDHDYDAIWTFISDERNWFLRARGEWDEENHRPLPRRTP